MRTVSLLMLLGLLAGCQTQEPLYYWGNYEGMLYKTHVDGGVSPQEQIDMLEQDISQAVSNGKKVHPGLHAHLGMLYAAIGDEENSHKYFSLEREYFPDSAPLLKGMEERAASKLKESEGKQP